MAVRQNFDVNEGSSGFFEQGFILRFLKKSPPDLTKEVKLQDLGTWQESTETEYRLSSKLSKADIEKSVEKVLALKVGTDFRVDVDEGTVFFTL